MRIVPEGRVDRLRYYETHIGRWAQDPEGIGSDADMVGQLAGIIAAARQALDDQRQAQQTARAATARFNHAIDQLSFVGGSVMQQIHSAGRVDKAVYGRASVPAPKKKSRIAPPGAPFKFTFNARQDGAVKLKWKCKLPRGSTQTIYHIWRSIGMDDRFVLIGHSGKKEFLDETIPRGTTIVYYRVRAVRTTCQSEPADYFLRFGTDGKVMPKIVTKRAA
jgi:hypothetical protein